MTTYVLVALSLLKLTLARLLKDHLVGPELESRRKLSTGNQGLQHLFCNQTVYVCAVCFVKSMISKSGQDVIFDQLTFVSPLQVSRVEVWEAK